ncbi:MAG: XdhC family protein [Eggerthellales bacterium]|nr:XdhC family protein [Eggerthellales bacterium]
MIDTAKRVLEWRASGKRCALAIVIETWGSSPRDVGSIMAVCEDGRMAGSVSGGCIEGSVVYDAQAVMDSGIPLLTRFSSSDEKAWEVGAPCGGDIETLILPYDDEIHRLLMECILNGQPVTLIACLDGISHADQGGTEGVLLNSTGTIPPRPETAHQMDGAAAPLSPNLNGPGTFVPFQGAQAVISPSARECQWMEPFLLDETLEVFEKSREDSSSLSNQAWSMSRPKAPGAVVTACGARMFCCRYEPRPRIVCVGAVHIASALVTMAKAAGYDTVVVDPRRMFLTQERFPDADKLILGWPQEILPQLRLDAQTALCALTHDEKIDVPALACALETNAFYLGCLGHAETLLKRAFALKEYGADPGQFHRIWGPIGLWIGGRTPGEIALSTLAQIQAVRCGRISKGPDMPGHTLDFYTPESVRRIAAARDQRKSAAAEVQRKSAATQASISPATPASGGADTIASNGPGRC